MRSILKRRAIASGSGSGKAMMTANLLANFSTGTTTLKSIDISTDMSFPAAARSRRALPMASSGKFLSSKRMLATHENVAAAQRELIELCGPFLGFFDGWATFGNTGEAAIEAE